MRERCIHAWDIVATSIVHVAYNIFKKMRLKGGGGGDEIDEEREDPNDLAAPERRFKRNV